MRWIMEAHVFLVGGAVLLPILAGVIDDNHFFRAGVLIAADPGLRLAQHPLKEWSLRESRSGSRSETVSSGLALHTGVDSTAHS